MSKFKNALGVTWRWRKDNSQPLAINTVAPKVKAYVVGFGAWREFMGRCFPERELVFLPKDLQAHHFDARWREQIRHDPLAEVFIWGFKAPPFMLDFVVAHNIKTWYVEDGFIRSVGLGSGGTPPMSLCLDSRTPYFDARRPSDLEILLGEYDFAANPGLMSSAQAIMDRLLSSGISKYNHAALEDVRAVYGPKLCKRVLVIGQVEDDASIRFGSQHVRTNEELLRIAVEENPGAQIIYKPHPALRDKKAALTSRNYRAMGIDVVLSMRSSLPSALRSIDHVYTMTSLAGMEAVLRGIPVTTLGCPFFAGWGLTDDRQPCRRRVRKLSVCELFAGAYMLYPKYFDPHTGHRISIEEAITRIQLQRQTVGDQPSGLLSG